MAADGGVLKNGCNQITVKQLCIIYGVCGAGIQWVSGTGRKARQRYHQEVAFSDYYLVGDNNIFSAESLSLSPSERRLSGDVFLEKLRRKLCRIGSDQSFSLRGKSWCVYSFSSLCEFDHYFSVWALYQLRNKQLLPGPYCPRDWFNTNSFGHVI